MKKLIFIILAGVLYADAPIKSTKKPDRLIGFFFASEGECSSDVVGKGEWLYVITDKDCKVKYKQDLDGNAWHYDKQVSVGIKWYKVEKPKKQEPEVVPFKTVK